MTDNSPNVGFISLGCSKALVDSERIITELRAEGYTISPSYEQADLVIVNTCGFIDDAVAESLDTIGEALAENGKVIVTGCLGTRSEVILDAHPQVLAVTGPGAFKEVMDAVHHHLPPHHDPYTSLVPERAVRLTPGHYAYLKIAEGCNHSCTFCIIPDLRGALVSRPIGEVMQEAERLVAEGVKELLVIAQDTSAYGADIKYRTGFWGGRPLRSRITDLARALGSLGAWVRLHYVYPYPHVDDLIPLMAEGRILPYLDVPFQHASPAVLKAMKRPAAAEDNLARVRRWREICPELVLRSTFIVGFPGETEDDFERLLDFLQEARLDRVGCFTYSAIEGARANELSGAVPEELKQERLERLMEVQAAISADRLQDRVGRRLRVLVDEVGEEGAIARSYGEAPEVDGVVIVEDALSAHPGDCLEVEIVTADEHDLYARLTA